MRKAHVLLCSSLLSALTVQGFATAQRPTGLNDELRQEIRELIRSEVRTAVKAALRDAHAGADQGEAKPGVRWVQHGPFRGRAFTFPGGRGKVLFLRSGGDDQHGGEAEGKTEDDAEGEAAKDDFEVDVQIDAEAPHFVFRGAPFVHRFVRPFVHRSGKDGAFDVHVETVAPELFLRKAAAEPKQQAAPKKAQRVRAIRV